MQTEQIINIISNIRPDNRVFTHTKIKENKDVILNFTKHLELSDKERIYHFIHQLSFIPKCPICNENRLFHNGSKGYFKTCGDSKCSRQYSYNTQLKKAFSKLTFSQKKFLIQNKIPINVQNVKIMLDNAYTYCPICGKLIFQRNTQTCSHKCNGKFKADIKTKKRKQTQLEKYGFNFMGLSAEDIANNITNISQKQSVKDKKKESNLKSFGHENAFHSPKARQNHAKMDRAKSHQNHVAALQQKYGEDVTNVMHIQSAKDKSMVNKTKSLQQKYGEDVVNPMDIPGIKERMSVNRRNFYNTMRFEDDYNGFLYVILSEKLNCIKIGVSKSNPLNRIKGIKTKVRDVTILKIIKCEKIYTLENKLHRKYDKFNKVQERQIQGRTEWFNKCIINDVLKDIEDYEEYITN